MRCTDNNRWHNEEPEEEEASHVRLHSASAFRMGERTESITLNTAMLLTSAAVTLIRLSVLATLEVSPLRLSALCSMFVQCLRQWGLTC